MFLVSSASAAEVLPYESLQSFSGTEQALQVDLQHKLMPPNAAGSRFGYSSSKAIFSNAVITKVQRQVKLSKR